MHNINYIEPVFRPPSEWRSLILQVTNGCSWNRCTFCEMYQDKQKSFDHKTIDDVRKDLLIAKHSGVDVQRVFLADGDAMTLSSRRLIEILKAINDVFPNIQRISSYCLPRNLRNKTVAELRLLNDLGLKLLYIGCESGDDEVLQLIDKGESYASSLEALIKISESGIKSSVMILNGLGGSALSEQHAINSARLMNESQPNYISTLVVSFPLGLERFKSRFPDFNVLTQLELFKEILCFLEHLELRQSIFRSDRASNYLILKGVLNKDKQKLIQQVQLAISHPEQAQLRQESHRGL